jgi:hypothetical protein
LGVIARTGGAAATDVEFLVSDRNSIVAALAVRARTGRLAAIVIFAAPRHRADQANLYEAPKDQPVSDHPHGHKLTPAHGNNLQRGEWAGIARDPQLPVGVAVHARLRSTKRLVDDIEDNGSPCGRQGRAEESELRQ